MAVNGFRLNKSWPNFKSATANKSVRRKFQRARKRALDQVARFMVSEIVDRGTFAANQPLTVSIKGGSTPLRDTRKKLLNSITTKNVNQYSVFIGISKSSDFYTQALVIHSGAAIRVTPRMRAMFRVLWLVSKGSMPASRLGGRAKELWDRKPGGWLPLKDSTTAIKIKARPFMDEAFGSARAKNEAYERFMVAIDQTFNEIAREIG